jgi:Fic family protein
MNNNNTYQPVFTITARIAGLIAEISEKIGRISVSSREVKLRKVNRVRTIYSSLAIEGNTLSEDRLMM